MIKSIAEFSEKLKNVREIPRLDLLSDDLLKISAVDISSELQRRLEGEERGNILVDGEEKSTKATLNLNLLWSLEKKDPEQAKELLEATKEKNFIKRK
ncbi:MAG: hypothetical protein COT61_02425 [Candidatus Portnoybacteria bacterium CG09_land_8_20_14_0_10_44_13]|uniref:Uncharacterized protein n=2 Tax=Candidatus Portnoyibacteriota TaxID=1817913 RepID=A0A2H0KPM9_9BACT|nr:MAG: hypothetical protein AUK17_03055 [Parcubacteria group bacterium CG2_30_44_18]PIQ74121.1 MAG: hypothetical protein COV85_03855 [Candidatus Portnoybacteria bacterium CG11_big_fil_rev_8_21_14_0_20_44_10]PIS16719.1 MAG: hypothetical protein COT61_02425 [Candidatus Portnoybacteria bacterium CG09_land_8_20_14_0_10_44_13]